MKNIIQALKVIALALILSFGISYVYAWTAPTVTPPNGNVSAPINTSATSQYKEGALGVGGLLKGYGDIQAVTKVEAPQYCIGASCITSWPTGGVTPPAGSEFLNTSATAQTKAGWLKAVGGNGGDLASRIGVGNNWWMSENTNGNYAIHRNGVGDKLTMDTNGNVVLAGGLTATGLNTAGTVTASGNIQGQHIKFPGVGGDSGAGADTYAIYQESGPWSYPYPDLRIQYHTGIKYDAYQGYGGHRFYTGWDGSGNPAGLQMQITDKVYVSTDVCTTAGKCLSTTGGAAAIDYGNCVTITHSYGLAGLSCGGVTVQANSGDCTPYTNYVMVSDSTGLRFPGACVAAVAKCCKLK